MKVDYQKTFIYKLCCRDPTISQIYVGHSTDFKQRNIRHKYTCNNINSNAYNTYKSRFIRENGNYENWMMIKLYDYPCDSKRDAEAEECKTMIELNATLNTHKPFITEEKKKQKIHNHNIQYRNDNKEELRKKEKIYRQKNKTEISEKKKVKVKCEFCGFESRKCHLKRHQKSLKCMKFQEFIDVE